MNRWLLGPTLLVWWLLSPAVAPACNIPVFRYALERWRNDRAGERYEIFVFHRGPLKAEEQAALDKLRAAAADRQAPANCDVAAIDLSATIDPELRQLWAAQKNATLPWVLVQFPPGNETRPAAWSGPLTSPLLEQLTTSPARREVAQRLMNGDSAVWLLLECGNAERDAATAATLARELRRLEKSVRLPDQSEESVKLLSDLPLLVRFSILRVAPDDPQEAMLRQLLLRAGKVESTTNGPIVFPIFGRGRLNDGLVGKELSATVLETEAAFLCGACSCEVKRLNPGVDLLIATDWDAVLKDRTAIEPDPPPSRGISVPIPTRPVVAAVAEPSPSTTVFGVPRPLVIGGVALAALLAVVTGTLALRSKRNDAPVD